MNKGLISVVIPVYNIEKYLDRCIKSVVDQTYQNIEIILVDDGSTDRSSNICDEWSLKDNRIKVIHKKNAGLGHARNTGIENASGDYICFFDGDDFIELETLEKCYSMMTNKKADIVVFGHKEVNKSGEVKLSRIPNTPKILYENEEVINQFLANAFSINHETGEDWKLSLSACFLMFSMKLILEAKFKFASEREIISEDYYAMVGLFKFIKRVAVIKEAFYNYCENEASLTRVFREDRFDKNKDFHYKLTEQCDNLSYPVIVKNRIWYLFFGNLVAHLKQLVKADISFLSKYKQLKQILNDSYLQNGIKNTNFNKMNWSIRVLMLFIKHKKVLCVYSMIKIRNLKR